MEKTNVICIQKVCRKFTQLTGKAVARIKAVGPMACQDKEKVKQIWQFYDGKVDDEVLDQLKSFGEVFCFFNTTNEMIAAIEHWFPSKRLIDDEEYTDVDEDYYVMIESFDPEGNDSFGI